MFNKGGVYLNVALNRQLGELPNLYQADFSYVLWVTSDVT